MQAGPVHDCPVGYFAGAFSAGAGPVDGPAGPTFGSGAGRVAGWSPQPTGAQRPISKRQRAARSRILFSPIFPPRQEEAGITRRGRTVTPRFRLPVKSIQWPHGPPAPKRPVFDKNSTKTWAEVKRKNACSPGAFRPLLQADGWQAFAESYDVAYNKYSDLVSRP
jgi:hypothetical protein